jgi:hypothetical protein
MKTSKTNIVKMLQEAKGKIVSIEYNKLDGKKAKITGSFHSRTDLGDIIFRDFNHKKGNTQEKHEFHTVGPKNIVSLKLNKVLYGVK